ncbi:BRCA1-associated protein-like isoform X1 [Dendrobium catenatum]|uniref:BRCA1-associated protein n=1 Tax=Dendrobium catenatum TaxID=906689 RepID=A0A2I0XGX6_9ASPA|nr:BRCA1-associated protein-like isoform X1 [Dendrobium catenatum]PKU87167.1 BRCA1-associated protein [Dendrobium catenatum]
MYCLLIHSVDSPPKKDEGFAGVSSANRQPPGSNFHSDSTATSSSLSPNAKPIIQVLHGIVHLYRRPLPLSSSSSAFPSSSSFPPSISDSLLPASRGMLLFVLAVPGHLSPQDFLRFCGSYADCSAGIQVIRNDGMEDRYSVLINFDDQKSADAFYLNLNGWKFSSVEGEICHILFLASLEFTESAEIACTPPLGSTELPTCPVCIERLDQEITGITSTTCDHSFQCSCILKWANSSCSVCQFCQEHSAKPVCLLCETSENLWICVICGFVGCGRYKEGHAFRHWKDTQHCFSLDLETQRVWDYAGDNYVHRINQSRCDDEFFKMKSNCRSNGNHCESCAFIEDSEISAALLSSKVEVIMDEYNRLLASQLENQRVYYETVLEDAKKKRERNISEDVDRAVGLKMQDIQLEIEKVFKEKKNFAEINENLMKSQNHWREKIIEIERRERETLRLKDQRIHELEEEIRDFTVFIEAQKALDIKGAVDDIRGGTLLPVPSPLTLSPRSKRSARITKKRS